MDQPNFLSGQYTALLIFSVIGLYYLYYYTAHSEKISACFSRTFPEKQKEMALFFFRKLNGFLIMGLIPGILWYLYVEPDYSRFGLSLIQLKNEFYVILILSSVIAIITFVRQKIHIEHNSLQMNIPEWDLYLFLFNCFGWILYLTGYEFLFRGILLFVCYNDFGFWPAVAINAVIYSAIHMVNGKTQTFGALIFGTLASYLTLTQGTLLIPLSMHISLSLFTDFFSLKMNKNLNYITYRNFKS